MITIDHVQGNRNDAEWLERLSAATVDPFDLDQWEAQRSRIRKKTEGGVELAVSLERTVHLRDGDVLWWDEAARSAIVARIQLRPVMIVTLDGLLDGVPVDIIQSCVELGHAIGNQHWPAVVKGTRVYVPLTVDPVVMASVMKTHAIPGISYEFVPAEEVVPYLAPHEARRLFGGAEPQEHNHVHPQ